MYVVSKDKFPKYNQLWSEAVIDSHVLINSAIYTARDTCTLQFESNLLFRSTHIHNIIIAPAYPRYN